MAALPGNVELAVLHCESTHDLRLGGQLKRLCVGAAEKTKSNNRAKSTDPPPDLAAACGADDGQATAHAGLPTWQGDDASKAACMGPGGVQQPQGRGSGVVCSVGGLVACVTAGCPPLAQDEHAGCLSFVFENLHAALHTRVMWPCLTRLNLASNQLSCLPQSVCSLVNLEELILENNSLTELPDDILGLSKLVKLDLHRNHLKALPRDLHRLSNMSYLLLGCNNLRALPPALHALQCLNAVDLNMNLLDLSEYSSMEWRILYFLSRAINQQRTPSRILPGVFLGGIQAVQEVAELARLGITHVLSVGPQAGHNHLVYKHVNVIDFPSEDLLSHFVPCCDFIDAALGCGGAVLVHCLAGKSRSAAVVIAYVMRSRRLSCDDAYQLVQTGRPCICPNMGFEKQLQQFEAVLREAA